ncbi:hypothetical protein MMC25_004470 [Agyrium rufum]|nr:hypothetical protein [Agyrium rufum]
MDVGVLRNRIQATLDPNTDIRRQAELDLKYAEEQPGFPSALLDIVEAETDNGVRQSTVVYLKNRVSRGWATGEEYHPHKPIPEDEKVPIRNRILPILASAPPPIRAQLIPTLLKILQYDFPSKWPNFMDLTMQLLNTNDANSVFAGLQCMLAICRTYRFKAGENREEFNNIVQLSFGQILSIGNGLVNEESLEAGEMLRLVVKTYKHAIYYELPAHLMVQDNIVAWCTLFIRIVGKDAPPSAMSEDVDEREHNHWWKAKKWSYANLNRLYVRYGNPGALGKAAQDSTEFAKLFTTNFAPEILKAYLQEIEKWVAKTTWLSKPALSYTLIFLDECVKPKAMWTHLRPHIETLLSHVIFPILCQSDEDLELFDSDPQEYVHRKLNLYEEVTAPDVAATNFLVSLTKSRVKQTFTILNFVNGIVNKYEQAPDNEKNPREKEGALRMIGSLAEVLLAKKSPIAHQVEYFFVRHVFPEFRSPHGFLRARACNSLQKFERLDFQEPHNLVLVYRNVLESMTDPDLPVRVEAAMALQALIRHPVIRTEMQTNIPQIMQQLLKLANEVDVDSLANVMEDFVEEFATELTPFAVALSEQLRDTYLRIVRDLVERSQNKDEDDVYSDGYDDKSITALGVLQTIGTLILTLESTPDVLLHLETILMPVVTITLENKLFDLYNEVFEIIDSCTFAAKAISPTMWQAFELMHKTFKAGAELYLEDMLPALDNFITFGHEAMIQQPIYIQAAFSMVEDIFQDEKVGGMDRICGCKLAETLMLNLPGACDDYIPRLIDLPMRILLSSETKVKSYRVHLLEMIINAIYYNPALALNVLEMNGWTNKFFSAWFSNIECFTRVHDKKLSILAISSLLTLRANEVPTSVQQGWPRLLQGVVRLFETLPAAVKRTTSPCPSIRSSFSFSASSVRRKADYHYGAPHPAALHASSLAFALQNITNISSNYDIYMTDREEATKESDFHLNSDDDDDDEEDDTWEGDETQWENDDQGEEGDVKDQNAAYLDFLSEEAQKFSSFGEDEDDEVLEEENLLETPIDKVEPYGLFKKALLTLQSEQPQLYDNLTKILNSQEQGVVQSVFQQADANEMSAAAAAAQAETNGNGVLH